MTDAHTHFLVDDVALEIQPLLQYCPLDVELVLARNVQYIDVRVCGIQP